jgi:phage gpG-like protein
MVVVMERRAVVVSNRVPFAGVHNIGGAAGNNAVEPARTFNEIEPEDVDVLVEMILDRARTAVSVS